MDYELGVKLDKIINLLENIVLTKSQSESFSDDFNESQDDISDDSKDDLEENSKNPLL